MDIEWKIEDFPVDKGNRRPFVPHPAGVCVQYPPPCEGQSTGSVAD